MELAPVHLPPTTAMLVLAGKYTTASDPRAVLLGMIGNFEARTRGIGNPGKLSAELEETSRQMREAQRRGERDLARLFAQLAMAQRSGDRERVARITDEISSNRKQVD